MDEMQDARRLGSGSFVYEFPISSNLVSLETIYKSRQQFEFSDQNSH